MAERDYRKELTERIIEALEQGTAPWQKPWDAQALSGFMPLNPVSGTAYRGGNVFALTLRGYDDPRWCTYRQADAKGWQVRKGERSTLIEFWKFHDEVESIDEATGVITKQVMRRDRPLVRYANVFNARQMDNVPELDRQQQAYAWDPIEEAERIVAASGAVIVHEHIDRAVYFPGADEIHLPPRDSFPSAQRFYATTLHELGHWTGHESRLKREFGAAFGDERYAREELRAELASFFLAARLGIEFNLGNHASYVASWLEVLREDKNEIFRAARDAEGIAEYVMGLGKQQEHEKAREGEAVGIERRGAQLRPNDMPAPGSPEYPAFLRAQILERRETSEPYQLESIVKAKLGADARFGHWAGEAELTGTVIVESKHSFVVQASEKEALSLNKLDFRLLPAVGQTVVIGAVDRAKPERGRPIRLAEAATAQRRLPTSEVGPGEAEQRAPARAGTAAAGRHYLSVPFAEKDAAKALGAKWDKQGKRWYVPQGMDPKAFAKWEASPEQPKTLTHSEIKAQFAQALREAGLVLKDDPVMDGKWQRTTVSTSTQTKALKGAYVCHLDDLAHGEVPNGYIKNHDTDYKRAWFPKGLPLNEQQRADFARAAAESQERRNAELAAEREAVAVASTRTWASLESATTHPYLARKGVEAFGLKIDGEDLVVPLRDAEGRVWNLQRISPEPAAEKLYEKGGQKSGRFHVIGDLDGADTVIFSEGYATGASEHMATGLPVIVCFDSGNLETAMAELAPRLQGKLKLVAGDDDVLTPERIEQHLRKRAASESGQGLGLGVLEAADVAKIGTPFTLAQNPACHVELRLVTGEQGVPRLEGRIRNKETGAEINVLLANIGREKALAAAEHDAVPVFPVFTSLEGRPSDFNDLHQREGLAAVRVQLMAPLHEHGRAATAQAVAARAIGDGAVVHAADPSRRYVGKVVGNTNEHAVQDVGRNTAVAHELARLDRVPAVGAQSRISYREGRGLLESGIQHRRERER